MNHLNESNKTYTTRYCQKRNQLFPDFYLHIFRRENSNRSEEVSIIDSQSKEVVKTIPVGKTAKGMNFTTDGKWAFVINEGEDTVTVIDVAQMKKSTVIEKASNVLPLRKKG